MRWEELEDDMHFTYLVGSVLARDCLSLLSIIELRKGLKGYGHEESTSNFDIHLPKKKFRIEMDEEFPPLFEHRQSLS